MTDNSDGSQHRDVRPRENRKGEWLVKKATDALNSFLNKLLKVQKFMPVLTQLGDTWNVSDELLNELEEFVCTSDVDLLSDVGIESDLDMASDYE